MTTPFERTITFSRDSASSPSSAGVGAESISRAAAASGVRLVDPHHPAAGQPAFRLQKHRAGGFENLERPRPELQAEDVAFVGQQVVPDAETRHRLEMRAHDPIDDHRRGVRRVVAAVLEFVQRRGAHREPFAIALVPLGDLRVQVPAVVVEPRRLGERPDVGQRPSLDLLQADDDVGDLDAEIVDVVLHFDRRAAKGQDPRERVAERGIPQMADVRGLVRIDRGVLDDGLVRRDGCRGSRFVQPRPQERGALEIHVQVAVGRGDDSRDAGRRAERRGQFLRDGARRFSQRARELKRDGDGEIAERAVRRDLDREGGTSVRPYWR